MRTSQEGELVMLFIGLGVLTFLLRFRKGFKETPELHLLFLSFYSFLLSWLFTVLESFVLYSLMNILEHVFYVVSGVLMAIWCFRISKTRGAVD